MLGFWLHVFLTYFVFDFIFWFWFVAYVFISILPSFWCWAKHLEETTVMINAMICSKSNDKCHTWLTKSNTANILIKRLLSWYITWQIQQLSLQKAQKKLSSNYSFNCIVNLCLLQSWSRIWYLLWRLWNVSFIYDSFFIWWKWLPLSLLVTNNIDDQCHNIWW